MIISLEFTSFLLLLLVTLLTGAILGAIGALKLSRWIHSSNNVTIVK